MNIHHRSDLYLDGGMSQHVQAAWTQQKDMQESDR